MTAWFSIRTLLACVILLLAGVLVFSVVRNFRGSGPEEVIETLPKNVDLALRRISYTETRNGVKRWAMQADSAAFSAGAGMTQVENIQMTFFEDDGREAANLTARSGGVETETGRVTLDGAVVVKSSRGYTIHTEKMEYLKNEDLIRSDVPVRIESGWMTLTSRAMRMRVAGQHLSLLGDVRTEIKSLQERTF